MADELGLLRALVRLGIPLSKLAEIPGLTAGLGGTSGLLGLISALQTGNVPGAVGSGATLGAGAASLLDMPGVSNALGAVGGPLSLISGAVNGDPIGATLGGLQTASAASGYLGGPTLGSLASGAYSLLPGAADAAALAAGSASELGLGAAGAAGGLGSSLASGLALGPFALLAAGGLHALTTGGGDMFDALFGEDRSQARSQTEDYGRMAEEFPGLAARRVAGASTFDNLGEMDTPEEITAALKTASSGRSANTEPMAWNLGHRPTATQIDPIDMSMWNTASPTLSGRNWGAFLNLMDKGEKAGIDPGGLTGDWNLGGPDGGQENTSGTDYRTRLGSYGTANQFHGDIDQTQEAQDMGNAVSGLAGDLGVDLKSKGGDYENFNADQLAGYGFTPGHYGEAALNYLRSYDPNVVNSPNWGTYTSALGDPSALGLLNLIPREMPASAPLPQAEFSGA